MAKKLNKPEEEHCLTPSNVKLVRCKPERKRIIPWEYCECGCHQNEMEIGEFSCSVFTSLSPYVKGQPMKTLGHWLAVPSHSYTWANFETWDEVNDRVVELIRAEIPKAEAKILELKKNIDTMKYIVAHHGEKE